ncbi:hypothetical protein [Fusobacterium gonidiaformans]|uniref:hypothetical protein n=1 Tax=Fusobacterium gonidiaformans TaxID=849 RepID=UPI0001BC681D|nr:hypothetical protein [Fusobacterium gonidiaformans]AVQ16305.1 hypothetical protein C4N16_01605 [Fusobacterium gonidiaformans ATCC 25563]EFS29280.1 hypothetical protein FGAG_01601 [Fusobacterium gonidiaformans ATCC 25563]
MKYSVYTWKEICSQQNIAKNSILLLDSKFFKIIVLTIPPSIDEEDRKETVYEKLSQDYFLDTKEISYIYECVLEENAQTETVFCCYLKEDISFLSNLSFNILFVIPSFLLGTAISKVKKYYLLNFQEKEVYIFLYENQKMSSVQMIQLHSEEQSMINQCLQLQMEKLPVILIGDYTEKQREILSQYFSIYDLNRLQIRKIAQKIDIFHHSRFSRKKKYIKYLSYLYLLGSCMIICLGFYWQYQIESLRTELVSLEKKISHVGYQMNLLEEEILKVREEQEKREQELEEQKQKFYQIHKMLWKIYEISKWKEIICIESLEDRTLKLKLQFPSQKSYLYFMSQLLRKNFKFLNHDRIERIHNKYEVDIEIEEAENEE